MTNDEVVQTMISEFAKWASEGEARRHGRGYYGPQQPDGPGDDPHLWHEGYQEGFRWLQARRHRRTNRWDGLAMDMLDAILVQMGSVSIPPATRALLAGSVLRYMAELD